MKKYGFNFFYVIVFCFLTSNAVSASFSWTGSVSSSWYNTSNWSPNGRPGPRDNVTIVTGSNNCVLDSNRTITNLTITSGVLDLGGKSLVCAGTVSASAGTIQNGILKPQGSNATFSGTTVSCRLESNSKAIFLSGGTFNGVCMITDSSGADSDGNGGCTFNDSLTIRHMGSGKFFYLAKTTGDVYNGPVTLINASNTSFRPAYTGNSYFNNNLIIGSEGSGGFFFGKGGGYSELDTNKTISVGSSGFRLGDLALVNFHQLSHTRQSLTFTDSSSVSLEGCTFNGPFSLSAQGFLLKNNTFQDSSTFIKNGWQNYQSTGGNTFNGLTTFNNVGSAGEIRLASSLPDNYNGNVVFYNTGGPFSTSNSIKVAYSGINVFKKDITNNGSYIFYNFTTGSIKFSGGNTQHLNGTVSYTFRKLTIDKSAGNVGANVSLTVEDSLILTLGKLVTTSTNLLTLKHGSIAVGASSASFVSGPVKKIGNSAFEFPIGKDNEYQSLRISASSNVNNSYQAQFFNTGQPFTSSVDTNTYSLNTCNYWQLNRLTGSDNVYVSLSYDTISCHPISSADNLAVLSLDTNIWINKGQDTIIGDYYFGNIFSASLITEFQYVTWGFSRLADTDCNTGNVFNTTNCTIELICNGNMEQGKPASYNNNQYPLGPASLTPFQPGGSEVINWEDNIGDADLYIRGNVSPWLPGYFGIPHNFHTNTPPFAPPLSTSNCISGGIDTHNGGTNNRYIGFSSSEGVRTNLISPLLPGVAYSIKFWAHINGCWNSPVPGSMSENIQFSICSDINNPQPVIIPLNPVPIGNSTSGTLWNQYTLNFVVPNGSSLFENLIMSVSAGYVFIDDVSLTTQQLGSFTNTPPCINQPTQFISYVSGGSAQYNWNFGDGNASTSQSPQHTYSEPGYYEVTLTVSTTTCSDCFRKVIYVSPSCCAVDGTVTYDDAGVVPDDITGTVSWTLPYKLNRTIYVKEDATLIIASGTTIEFGPEGRIVLERRDLANTTGTAARMNMQPNSTLTSITETYTGCPVMWQGVEVWGHNTISHFSPSTNQQCHARLRMYNSARIANAHNGVLLGRTMYPFGNSCIPIVPIKYPPYDFTYGGGILTADDADLFSQNGVAIRILPFPFSNATRIIGCRIYGGTLLDPFYDALAAFHYSSLNNPNRNPWYGEANKLNRACIGIYMLNDKINSVIQNNSFSDIQKGIESYDSQYRVFGNSFDEHQYGIDVNNIVPTPINQVHIRNNNSFINIIETVGFCGGFFSDNAGIRIRAGRLNRIDGFNSFGDNSNPSTSTQPPGSVGIQLFSSNQTIIMDNDFGDIFMGIYTSGSFISSGIIGYTSQGNTFNSLGFRGIFSINGNNAMQVRCNNFFKEYNCSGYGCWMNTGTLPASQGNPGGSTKRPAGNEWNIFDNFADKFVTSINFNFIYRHHDEVASTGTGHPSVVPWNGGFILNNNGSAKTNLSCVPGPIINNDQRLMAIDSINVVIDSLTILKDSLVYNSDHGKTDSLISYINDSLITSQILADSLTINSPLSDEVLANYLERIYPILDSDFVSVMSLNLPVSNSVINSFLLKLNSFSDSLMADSLMKLYGDNSITETSFAIERSIESSTLERNEHLTDVIDYYVENDSLTELVNLLNNQNALIYKMDAVGSLIQNGNLSTAREILSTLTLSGTADEDWGSLIEIALSLADSGLTYYSMDSVMISTVYSIANRGIESTATRNAQCILQLVFGIDYNDGFLSDSTSLRVAPHQSENSEELVESPKNANSLKIYPNPSNSSINVEISKDETIKHYQILNFTGNIVKLEAVSHKDNRLKIELQDLPSGIYSIVLYSNSNYYVNKFEILK